MHLIYLMIFWFSQHIRTLIRFSKDVLKIYIIKLFAHIPNMPNEISSLAIIFYVLFVHKSFCTLYVEPCIDPSRSSAIKLLLFSIWSPRHHHTRPLSLVPQPICIKTYLIPHQRFPNNLYRTGLLHLLTKT